MIVPANDDQIFLSAGEEQPTVAQKAEVAGAHIGTVAIGREAAERRFGLLGTHPISARDARAFDPNLADAIRRTDRSCLRIDDLHGLTGARVPARAQRDRAAILRGHGDDLSEL